MAEIHGKIEEHKSSPDVWGEAGVVSSGLRLTQVNVLGSGFFYAQKKVLYVYIRIGNSFILRIAHGHSWIA